MYSISKRYFKIAIIVISIFLSFNSVKSQQGICPPETSSWNSDNAEFVQPMLSITENLGSVDYKWHNNGSIIDVFVDWNSIVNTSGYFELSNDDLKSLLILQIIYDRYPCPYEGTKTISFTDVVECTVERSCYFRVSNDQEFLCIPEEWPGPPPQFMINGNDKLIVKTVTENCGSSCCKTYYLVGCTAGSAPAPGMKPIIHQILKQTVPGSECNSQTNYIDCLTGEPVECKSSCQ